MQGRVVRLENVEATSNAIGCSNTITLKTNFVPVNNKNVFGFNCQIYTLFIKKSAFANMIKQTSPFSQKKGRKVSVPIKNF